MTDWYPPICDDESIINSILNNHTSFFEVREYNYHGSTAQTATTSFINLIINNYHFSYFTLLNSVTELNSATDLYAHHLAVECQNCQFTNISFTCEENPNISPYLIVAYALYFSNVTISDVVISCESSSMFAQEYYMIGSEIVLDDVLISNIWIQHSIFKTIHNNITLNNCIFENINTGYDIFGEHTVSNDHISITNTKFSHIYAAIYLSNISKTFNDRKQLYVHIENTDFIIDSAGIDTALFEFDLGTDTTFNNINLYYDYNLSQHCSTDVFLFPFGVIPVICNNPQAFIKTQGACILSNISLNSNMNEINNTRNARKKIQTQIGQELDISYSFRKDNYGLINNIGDSILKMKIINMTVSPFAFHFEMIGSTKSIELNNVQIVHDTSNYIPHDYSHLESNIFLNFVGWEVSDTTKKISIINCDINSIRGYVFGIANADDLEIIDSNIVNAGLFVEVLRLNQVNIINSHFANAYDYMFYFLEVNNININTSYFATYGKRPIMYEKDSKKLKMANNIFEITSQLDVLSVIETAYFKSIWLLVDNKDFTPENADFDNKFLASFVLTTNAVGIETYIVSNYFQFGYDNYIPAFNLRGGSLCLSNNTFFNFALLIHGTSITSCFKAVDSNDDTCRTQYGAINEELYNKMSYFILNNSRVEPIKSLSIQSIGDIFLENIIIQIFDNRTQLFLPYMNRLLLADVSLESKTNIDFTFALGKKCIYLCHEKINDTFRTQIKMRCDDNLLNPTNVSISEWSGTEYISHGIPNKLLLNPINNGQYYPGEFMKFNVTIHDKFGNKIIPTYYNLSIQISMSITIDGLTYTDYISMNENGYCEYCESGVYISSITLDNYGETYTLMMQDENNRLILTDIHITVQNCPVAYGKNVFNVHCTLCAEGFYQLLDNYTADYNHCKPIEITTGNRNAFQCIGGDNIIISQHHWISVDFDNKNKNSIISSFCVYGYCCVLPNGCNYLYNKSSLCASNRDANIPLCGSCLNTFSESMNGSQCVDCNGRHIYWEWLLFPLSVSILMATYIILSKSHRINKKQILAKNSHNNKIQHVQSPNVIMEFSNEFKRLISNQRFVLMVSIISSKVIFYYE
eukprot:419328_1